MLAGTSNQFIGAGDGVSVDLGTVGARLLLEAIATEGRVALIEHWVPPRTLAAPLHRHTREDEYSLVLEGHLGLLLGECVIGAGTGDFVQKPRGQWHTFWNPGHRACRLLEIISPAGFEAMFKDLAADPNAMTGESAAALDRKYGIEVDYGSIEWLCAKHDLSFPE